MGFRNIEDELLKERIAIVPVLSNSFVYQSRRFKVRNCENGWYRVGYYDDRIWRLDKLSVLQTAIETKKYKSIVGYKILDGFVFDSFAQEKILTGNMAQQHQVHFAEDRVDWDMILAIRWEDGNLYYCQDYHCQYGESGIAFVQVFRRFQEKRGLEGARNVTPEMRLVYILARMEQQRIELQLEVEAETKAEAEFLKTLKGRLITTLHDAGAEYVSHRQQGNNAVVLIWRMAGQQFNSIVRTGGNFQIKELGFCASGHDKEHTLVSAVNLARGYIKEEGDIYITRS